MTQGNIRNVDSLRALTLSFLFTAFIFGVCILVVNIRPVSEPSIPDTATAGDNVITDMAGEDAAAAAVAESVESMEEELDDAFIEDTPPFDETALAADMQDAVIVHAQLEDTGLLLYRNIESRAKVVWFYSQITGDAEIAEAILYYADHNNIPLSLAFSLAWTESKYNKNAVNSNNRNATIDRGLFQLNSGSFPSLAEADFFNPYVSAKNGLSHLRFCLDTAGNEIAALAMYNAGTTRVRNNSTPQSTLNYVSTIIGYQKGLDELFAEQIVYSDMPQQQLVALISR